MSFKGDIAALILGILQDGRLHGYEISKRIRSLSQETLSLGEGQLYPALHRLEEDGLIDSSWDIQEGRPNRKVYEITPVGLAELKEKKKAWEKFTAGVNSILMASKEGANG
ncbi:MAG: helix-turn-helix transcriptional regulator [Fimbriimonadaceae bacterium]|nr:helix-turn-helix transcriptional regulator [Fimbriimonadaceae bacterium]